MALVLAAVLAFALGDVLTKHLTMRYDVSLVLAGRYVVNLVLLVAFFAPHHGWGLVRTNRTGLVLVRAGCLAVGSLTMGFALRWMPVAETIAIIYLAPFAVMILAIPLLKERVSLAGWLGAVAGFTGILLIVRPGSGLVPLGVAFALLNAGAATVYHLLSRLLARTDTTMAMLFHTALVGSLVFLAALPWSDGSLPGFPDMALLLALGVFATLGHFLFTAAYREAPASLLAPMQYVHLIWAAGLGWLVFGDIPDNLSLLGMLLVIVAGMALALRSHRSQV
ncbi:DMT family transporter [Rubellimicrobium roseum]|nr:DMT family transporter [Rubellimicrobium roseum]